MSLNSTMTRASSYAGMATNENQVDWKSVVFALAGLFVVSRVVKYFSMKRSVDYLPGIISPFDPLRLPGALLPTSRFNLGLDFPWNERFNVYKECKAETISILPFVHGESNIYTSNLDVARQVVAGGAKSHWIKPEGDKTALLLFGMNLLAADKDTWRRHRRIVGPAFNNKAYALVWDRAVQTYADMIATEGWSDRTSFDVPVVQRLTFKLALIIIGKCGFGFDSFSWSDELKKENEEMSIQQCLKVFGETVVFAIFMPRWMWKLPVGWIREMRTAHETLMAFVHAQIADRETEVRSGAPPKDDVFSMLIRANEEDGGKLPLDDSELIGNVFILLFAGHETTAHALAATLGLLGLHQDIQDEVLEQILQVVGPTREPAFEDYESLYKVRSTFQEALRMFQYKAAASLLIRSPTEDTVLVIPNAAGEEGTKTLPIKKGQRVVVDMIGLQYNPRHYPEPEKYKPSRWYGAKESEFLSFSFGPRQCIGNKFAMTEAVAFLTVLLRDWKVEPLLNGNETIQQWSDRIMQGKMMITMGVRNLPIRFTRRAAKA